MRAMVMFVLVSALLVASAAPAAAQTYSVLYSFAGGADGGYPGPVTLDASTGNLYGATPFGGSGGCGGWGCGTVFEITPGGVKSILYAFEDSPDGGGPIDVLLDAKGNLFGTTSGGGADGYGTVFKIDPNGTETVLHSFQGSDGKIPSSGLIQDPNTGDFYGVTRNGGAYDNEGTVYKITPTGAHTVLYSFGAPGSGGAPAGKLVEDGTGNLYGTTPLSGGCGTVFELTAAGVEAALYVFGEQRGDGCEPGPYDPGLVMDAKGNLFGTTVSGGTGWGVVFELTAVGVEKVIYKFKGPKKGDGVWPQAGLVLDESTGNLYGTTDSGGTGPCLFGKSRIGCGTIFELSPPITKHGRWRETVLYSFGGGADGNLPLTGLTLNAQTGDLYGTTEVGGAYGWGVVFKLTP